MGIYEDAQKAHALQESISKSFFGNESPADLAKRVELNFEKAKKAAVLGEIREFGGKKYKKIVGGWRLLPKGEASVSPATPVPSTPKAAVPMPTPAPSAPSTPKTSSISKAYDKSLAEKAQLKAKIDALNKEYHELDKKSKESYRQALEKIGFKKERDIQYGEYVDIHKMSIVGGTNFANGHFVFKNTNSNDNVYITYKDKTTKDPIELFTVSKLENIEKIVKAFEKNPEKGFDTIRERIQSQEGARKDSIEYALKDFNSHVDSVKRNFFTGRKSSSDVKLMNPKEIMSKFNIPNTSYTSYEGKRSSIFGKDTHEVANNIRFFDRFKEYYEKFGKPVKVTTEKFDTREDDYEYEASRRGEREWSYAAGNKVVITFKDKDGRIQTIHS